MTNSTNGNINLTVRATADRVLAAQGVQAIDQMSAAISRARQNGKMLAEDAKRNSLEVVAAYQNNKKAAQSAAQSPNLNLKSFSRDLSGIGASGLGSALGGLDDVSGVIDGFKAIKAAIASAGGVLPALGGLVAALGPIPIVIGAAALAFAVMGREAAAQAAEAQRASDALKEYFQALRSGSQESIKAQIADLTDQQKIAQAELEIRKSARDSGFKYALEQSKGLGAFADAAARALTGIGDLQGRDQANLQAIDELTKKIPAFGAQIAALNRAITTPDVANRTAALNFLKVQNDALELRKKEVDLLKQSSDALKDRISAIETEKASIKTALDAFAQGPQTGETIKRIDELVVAFNKLNDEEKAINQAVLPLVEAREREQRAAEALGKTLSSIGKAYEMQADRQKELAERQKKADRQAIEDGYKKQIESAKQQEAIDAHTKKLGDIDAEAKKREAELRQRAGLDNNRAVVKFTADEKRINDDYMRGQLKALEEYRKQEAQAQDKYAKERRRLLEDLNDDLIDLAREGDVAGFLSRQKAGEKDLRRLTEDNDDAAKERLAAFADQQKEAEAHYAEQLKDLRQNFETEQQERRTNLRAELEDLRQQTEQKKQQEEEAFQTRITRSQQLEQEFQAQREQWAREDEAAVQAAQDTAFNDRYNAAKAALDKETLLVTSTYEEQLKAAQSFSDQLRGIGLSLTGSAPQHFANAKTSDNLKRIEGFANGGYPPIGQPFVVGENGPETMVMGRQSTVAPIVQKSLSVNLGGVTIGAGNGVTRDDLNDLAHLIADIVEPEVRGAS